MGDERQVENPPEAMRKHKKTRRERELEAAVKSRMTPDDLAAAHRKFVFIMVALFAIALILMFAFNNQFDFMSTGGM